MFSTILKKLILQSLNDKISFIIFVVHRVFVEILIDMQHNMKDRLLGLTLLLSVVVMASCSPEYSSDGLLPTERSINRPFGEHDRELFVSPDKVHYPQTWFHFIGSNVSLEGITADLEAIAGAGFSGVQFFHGQFGGKWPEVGEGIAPLSENWDETVRQIATECRRLGLRFTIQNCPGWSMAGGPWISPENAMRLVVSSRTDVSGKDVDIALPKPQHSDDQWRDYRDIAVLAFPTPEGDTGKPLDFKSVRGDGDFPWEKIMSGEIGRMYFPPAEEGPHWVEVQFNEPVVIRTFEFSSVNKLNHDMSYEPCMNVKACAITADGQSHKIVDAPLPQSNWQDDDPVTFACPEVKDAVACRIEIDNTYGMNLGHIRLYTAARKNSWESEAGLTLRSFERTADDVVQSASAYIKSESIVDVTGHVNDEGRLAWTAPEEGNWTILRIGHVNAGEENGPAPKEGTGWECDKLSTEGPEAHFAGYVGRLAEDVLNEDGLLDGLLLDSWECHTQTWTMKMEDEFALRCGYDLRRWLPAVFGYVIDEPETTSRFLLDWRGTIGDLFANKFYRRMAELGHEKGMSVVYETAAGDVFPADIMEYFKYADVPMCEFWQPFNKAGYVGSLNFKPIIPTASAARMYGKPRVDAESFTSFVLTWDEHLEMLKEYADYHYTEGVTHNIFHTYTHNPQIDFLPPGSSMGRNIGTPFLRGQTWWPYVGGFVEYLARCSYMLERGRPVSDVLWYLGDEISHKPDQECDFPEGYKYDYCNPDVLLNRLSVRDGKIVTPEGLSYSMMWIPENKRMLPETLEKIYELIKAGAVVVAEAPRSIATLSGGEEAQKRFDAAVEAIWGEVPPCETARIGKGIIDSDTDIKNALARHGIKQDVKGGVRWIHRNVKGADWYFVTPKKQSSFKGSVAFSAEGAVELWDPVTGQMSPVKAESRDGYTVVDLDMPKAGSCFVVFNRKERHRNPEPKVYGDAVQLSGPWKISFPEGWGVPADTTVSQLLPWCDMMSSPEAKAFSGKAVYSTRFTVGADKVGKPMLLDLGKADMIAVVRINGKEMSPIWCQPYSVDIGEYIKEGVNDLEIDVVSTWFNRLVFDASLPEGDRKTWVIAGPKADKQLRPAGLMGPVTLK